MVCDNDELDRSSTVGTIALKVPPDANYKAAVAIPPPGYTGPAESKEVRVSASGAPLFLWFEPVPVS